MILQINTAGTNATKWLNDQIKDIDHYGENGTIFIPNVNDIHIGENETIIFQIKKTKYYMPMIFTNGTFIQHQGG